MYKEKYLSYKQKYLNLKKIQEGGATENEKLAIFLEKYGGSISRLTDEQFAKKHGLENPLEIDVSRNSKKMCAETGNHKYLKPPRIRFGYHKCYKKKPEAEAPAVAPQEPPAVEEQKKSSAPAVAPAAEAGEEQRKSSAPPAAEAEEQRESSAPPAAEAEEEQRESSAPPAAEAEEEQRESSAPPEVEDDSLAPPPPLSANPLKRLPALPAAEEKPNQSGGKFYELEFNKNLINK